MNITSTESEYRLFVGVDIAATTAAVAWMHPRGKVTRAFTIEQTPQGFALLQQKILATGCVACEVLIVMEATGCYWIALANTLAEFGFRVSVVNPAQAHHFAKALLKRSKTDAIDAQTLANLASLLRPEPWTAPPAIYHQLQQRLSQRDGLLHIRTQLRNQLHALKQHPVVVQTVRLRLEMLLQTLEEQMAQVEAELEEVLATDKEWKASAQLLQTIKGIGLITTSCLLVATLNFTTCETIESLTAYAGLAPALHQSGISVWHKPTIGHTGNARLRAALYLATLSSAQSNLIIKAFLRPPQSSRKTDEGSKMCSSQKVVAHRLGCGEEGATF
jgi:transposase